MLAVEIIAKKRDGLELSREELQWLVSEFLAGNVPDYQMAAWLMAVYLRGMTTAETVALTEVFLASGQQLDLSFLPRPTVDKHSTGGVGDKTSLVLAPLLAAAGLAVAKLTGRGLGHTGGTIDKLESIPGFTTDLTDQEFLQNLRHIGLSMIGAGPTLAPADKQVYALRDVTATVGSLPLIASSIMSKKLAGGAQHIVLDVKYGRGALMPTLEAARRLAEIMMSIGQHFGRKMGAILSDMNQPLGYAVGNSIEVKEAIDVLQNRGPADVRELVLALASELMVSSGLSSNNSEAKTELEQLLVSGAAWEKFVEFVTRQGGDARYLHDPSLLPSSPQQLVLAAPEAGFVAELDAHTIGQCAVKLGAGRTKKDGKIDKAAGIVLLKKREDWVEEGEALAVLHGAKQELLQAVAPEALSAWQLSLEPVEKRPLIAEILRS
ncbi:MAG: thymidine phosphorylase [Firmicutes bacterium]|nr:thymidine phosphorylase [Bacillota bacterium]